jgi:Ca2+-binding RTX toxin-like protein
VPEVLQRLGLDPASIRFEQVGTSEPDRVVVKSNDIRSFALGPGSDHFIVKDSRSRTPFTVDAGDGSDLIRTRLGSDVILAGAGDDRVKASASSKPRAKGEAEVDLVSGGLGSDLFVLGNRQGSFYLDLKGRGDSSYALISDFGSGDRITLSKSLAKSYRIEATSVPGLPDVSAYALSVRQDVVAVIVLDPSRDEGLSIKDRSSFVFEKR